MTIECVVTRYSIFEGRLVETTKTEVTTCGVEHDGDGEPYLCLHNSAASAPLSALRRDAAAGRSWPAQAGSPPVYVEPCSGAPRVCGPSCGCGLGDDVGGWGGRNYPKIVVAAPELKRVIEELVACGP